MKKTPKSNDKCIVCKKPIKGNLILFSGNKFDSRACVTRFKSAHARMVCEFC